MDTSKLYFGKCLTLDQPSSASNSVDARLAALERQKGRTPKDQKKRESNRRQEICRKYNQTTGCTDPACERRHCCNVRVNGGPCGLHHPRHEHV